MSSPRTAASTSPNHRFSPVPPLVLPSLGVVESVFDVLHTIITHQTTQYPPGLTGTANRLQHATSPCPSSLVLSRPHSCITLLLSFSPQPPAPSRRNSPLTNPNLSSPIHPFSSSTSYIEKPGSLPQPIIWTPNRHGGRKVC